MGKLDSLPTLKMGFLVFYLIERILKEEANGEEIFEFIVWGFMLFGCSL